MIATKARAHTVPPAPASASAPGLDFESASAAALDAALDDAPDAAARSQDEAAWHQALHLAIRHPHYDTLFDPDCETFAESQDSAGAARIAAALRPALPAFPDIRHWWDDIPEPAPATETAPARVRFGMMHPRYGIRDRANTGHPMLPPFDIQPVGLGGKKDPDVGDGDKAIDLRFSRTALRQAEAAISRRPNNSLYEITGALHRAWQITRHGFGRLWRSAPPQDADVDGRVTAAPVHADETQSARHLTYRRLGAAVAGMAKLVSLRGLSAVPLVLLIFRWIPSHSHDSCSAPSEGQLPAWQIEALQVAMTFLSVAGTGAYVVAALRQHWRNLSLRQRCAGVGMGMALSIASANLTYYDKTVTFGRFLAGMVDKYIEIQTTNGWTAEVGPGDGDARTLAAWGGIVGTSLFLAHMIRSAVFVGIEQLLHLQKIGDVVEILLRALGKVASEVIAFGALMPLLMTMTNTLLETRFVVKRASRSLSASLRNAASRGARMVRGEASPASSARTAGRLLLRPFMTREYWSKLIALPNLGHNTVCAGSSASVNGPLWLGNATGEAILEVVKAAERLALPDSARGRQRSHDSESSFETFSLAGDVRLRADALPSNRLFDEVDDDALSDAPTPDTVFERTAH